MRAAEVKISRFLNSRPFAILTVLIGLILASVGAEQSAYTPGLADGGFVFPSPDVWFHVGTVRVVLNILLLIVNILLLAEINRSFNLLRTSSLLFLAVFSIMECATPSIVGELTSALLLNIIVLGIIATFYTLYQQPNLTRRIFLVYFIMSALCMCDYIYVIYIIAFLPAFSQMRVSSPRMFLAALIGIVTPWWIVWGAGMMPESTPHMPDMSTLFDANNGNPQERIITIVTVGITVIFCFLLSVINMVKIYAYNAKSRAFGGLLTILSLITALATLVNFANATHYLSLLNCFTAVQFGLFFRSNENRRAYLLVILIMAVYISLFISNMMI